MGKMKWTGHTEILNLISLNLFQIAHVQTFMGFKNFLILNKHSWNCQTAGLRKLPSLLMTLLMTFSMVDIFLFKATAFYHHLIR